MHRLNYKKLSLALIALLLIGLTTACSNSKANKVTVMGSSAMQVLAEQAGHDFHKDHPNSNIIVQGGGSGTGLSQIQAGAVEIGTSDVFAENQKGIDASKLTDYKIAVVGIIPIVDKGTGVKNLSTEQLAQIFMGKITNWKQVGGKNIPITVINRSKGSGTRSTFERLILGNREPMKAQEQDSNGTVRKIVSSTPGTISYISAPYAKDSHIQKLSLNGVKPTNENITTNKWKLWSYEHAYTKGKTNKMTKEFLNYLLSKKVQNGLIPQLGYISIDEMKVTRDSNNQVISN
ncbi:phosphate ABC transporter substrate-binding protein [Lactobacillus sp. PV034]|uniref:phosphate ABC transporter substrate-binding protein n=1 Tax=Lactobacillus sp. PV034 TaxID=2594495 RepID=UPI002240B463|nr:phosphate ABC transporter substrate-binding protein [Lactobacillus sp. PV034]QNQ80847.1 phosphate ABC transporter substrate-binding protein [Lactobacillus sp. PV034]